MIVTLPIKPLL